MVDRSKIIDIALKATALRDEINEVADKWKARYVIRALVTKTLFDRERKVRFTELEEAIASALEVK